MQVLAPLLEQVHSVFLEQQLIRQIPLYWAEELELGVAVILQWQQLMQQQEL